jgi:hypothetical protein
MRKYMRRFTISLLAGLLLTLASLGSALGHVHGITPLNCAGLTTENANAGGNGTNGTPADDANGGPIAGVIPVTTGNAPLVLGPGVGGRHSSLC